MLVCIIWLFIMIIYFDYLFCMLYFEITLKHIIDHQPMIFYNQRQSASSIGVVGDWLRQPLSTGVVTDWLRPIDWCGDRLVKAATIDWCGGKMVMVAIIV